VTVKVRGLRELEDTLDELRGSRTWERAAQAAAEVLAPAAAALAPRRRGALSGSIRAQGGAVVSALPYAGVIHNGWARHNIAPHPFIREAETRHDAWLDAFTDAITD
jgi:hypothetical protein